MGGSNKALNKSKGIGMDFKVHVREDSAVISTMWLKVPRQNPFLSLRHALNAT